MEISWLGHSCFRIKGSQAALVTDPYPATLASPANQPTASIVTVSHPHPGHSFTQGVKGDPRVIRGPGEFEIGGVLLLGIPTCHDAEKGKARGKNTVFLFSLDDLSVCHLGDLGHLLNTEQIEDLGNVDVLLLPVGGVSTINATMAAEVVRQLEPKVVVPMHYRREQCDPALEPVDRFLKEMGVKEIAYQPKLVISRNTLPASMQVLLLECPLPVPAAGQPA